MTKRRSWLMAMLLTILLALVMIGEGRALVAGVRRTRGDWAGALRLTPRNGDYWAAAGHVARRDGARGLAIVAFSKAVTLDRFRASHHYWLAQAELESHGLTSLALAELRSAVQLNPTQSLYRKALNQCEERIGLGKKSESRIQNPE